MTTIREASFPGDADVVRALFSEYAAGLGVDLCFQGFADELATLPGRYARPAGGVWLATEDGDAVGCVALRVWEPGVGEIKRLYVRPSHRGAGLGKRLVETVLTAAVAAGCRRVVLDTLDTMAAAVALYRSLGFVDIPPYGHHPVDGTLYLGRDLAMAFNPYQPRPLAFLGVEDFGGQRLKVYSIRYGEGPLDRASFAGAWDLAAKALPSGGDDGRPGVGFVILHRGKTGDYFILGWWDRQNELPLRVLVRDGDGWRPCAGGESLCVWDLRVVWWEREAYVGTVLAGRADGAAAYLATVTEGWA